MSTWSREFQILAYRNVLDNLSTYFQIITSLKPRLYAQFAPWCKFTPGCKIAPWSKFATPYVAFICQINCVHMLLDLLFKHITNVSVLLKGEIPCVKNVSIMSQFKIPACSIWFYLLYLFIQYLKRIIHQSFISTAPTYGDSR